jgi:hypothetical protein
VDVKKSISEVLSEYRRRIQSDLIFIFGGCCGETVNERPKNRMSIADVDQGDVGKSIAEVRRREKLNCLAGNAISCIPAVRGNP